MESTSTKNYKIYADKPQRDAAFGSIDDTLEPILVNLASDAETIFGPKKIISKSDWLNCYEEKGQNYEKWLTNSKRNKVNSERSKIYLNIIDPSITSDFQQALFKYCQAFFTGLEVVLTPPEEGFMTKHKIENRIHWDTEKI